MPTRISRSAYAGMYGPTTGDRVRLADTDLMIEVEKDFTTYGEEVKSGGGTRPTSSRWWASRTSCPAAPTPPCPIR